MKQSKLPNLKINKMKRLLLLTAILIGSICQAQDYGFLAKLKEPVTTAQAMATARQMADAANSQYRLYKSKEFNDSGIYLVVFAPEGVTDEQIIKQKHNDNCFSVYFKKLGDDYVFDKAVVNYEDIYHVWHTLFNKETQPDKKTARIQVADKGVYFSLNQSNPNWIIRR